MARDDPLLHEMAMSARFEPFVDAFQALGERLPESKDRPGWGGGGGGNATRGGIWA